MKALAFSNNDIAVIAWTYDRRLDGCLGFAVYRCAPDGSNPVALQALASFDDKSKGKKNGEAKATKHTTEEAPVQKFWWKDLAAKRGEEYVYKIVPLTGAPGALKPMPGVPPLKTNRVRLTSDRAPFKAYFNRGIVSTQALAHELDKPDAGDLRKRISRPDDKLRIHLMGELYDGVTSLLARADKDGGEIKAALYELNDPQGLELRLQANPKNRTVILGNEWSVDEKTKEAIEDVCVKARKALKKAKVDVTDRMVPKGQIPHNKFVVLFENEKPAAVLTGSTNWTSTGLATQTNNALVIESPRVARAYADYWDQLFDDTKQAKGDSSEIQSGALRDWTRKHNDAVIANPIKLEDGTTTIELMFSPNTKGLLPKKPKPPNDMKRLFELVLGAKQAVLFLAFDPGNNSILDAAGQALKKNPNLFVRGTLTNAQRAGNFKKALKGPGDQKPKGKMGFEVAVIGEAGKPKKKGKGAKGKGAKEKKSPPDVDYRAVPAGAVTDNDKFGAWEKELYKVGFAIIHNKVVVIDPFSDDCVVITGSHNLGYRASHNNDENMVIIHGNRPLAEAYACHTLDLYDHYAWRYWLRKFPKKFGRPLDKTDGWQDRYIKDADEKSPELRFWLGAIAQGGQ